MRNEIVTCSRCGQEWPRDPALEVACPSCPALIGKRCKRGSGHNVWGNQPHASRDRLAMERGFMKKCPGSMEQKYVSKELEKQVALF